MRFVCGTCTSRCSLKNSRKYASYRMIFRLSFAFAKEANKHHSLIIRVIINVSRIFFLARELQLLGKQENYIGIASFCYTLSAHAIWPHQCDYRKIVSYVEKKFFLFFVQEMRTSQVFIVFLFLPPIF